MELSRQRAEGAVFVVPQSQVWVTIHIRKILGILLKFCRLFGLPVDILMPLSYQNPVYGQNLADPFVLHYAGEYYAYGTGSFSPKG